MPDRAARLDTIAPATMAKAAFRNQRIDDGERRWREAVGKVVEQVQGTLSLKEFAAKLKREERQVARWKSGDEHAQVAAIFAVPEFQQPLIVGLAQLAHSGVAVETTITIRRIA